MLRAIYNSLLFNTAASRLYSSFVLLSQSLSANITLLRTGLFLRTPLESIKITDNVIYTTFKIVLAFISDSINVSTTVTKSFSIIRSITAYFTMNLAASRTQLLLRLVIDSPIINGVLIKTLTLFRLISQSFTTSSISNRLLSISRSITSSFIVTDTFSRIISIYRSITGYFTINLISLRISSLTRIISDSFITTLIVSRIRSTYLSVSQSLYIITTSYRIINFIRTTISSIIFNQIPTRTAFIFKSITTGATIANIARRILNISRILSEGFYLTTMASRVRTLIRFISEPITIQSVVNRVWWLFSKWFCFALGDEQSCAHSGCYWCSGACQSSTCPTPSPPSGGGGGGGGFIPITPVTPAIPTVLDTEVHMETEQVVPGDKTYATITILKVKGPDGAINVNLSYWVSDSSGKTIGSKYTAVAVETIRRDIYYILILPESQPGAYKFECLAQYDNASDSSFATFEVVSKLPAPLININGIDVPMMLEGQNATIRITLENTVNEPLDVNTSILLPVGFEPREMKIQRTIQPLSEEVIEFEFTPKVFGSFTGFVSIEYEGKKIIKDFNLYVYSPLNALYPLLQNWWIVAIPIALLIVIYILYKIYKKYKQRRKFIYVFKKEDLYK